MKNFWASVLWLAELLAVGLAGLAWSFSGWDRQTRHTLLVLAGLCAAFSVLLSYAGLRGLVRRLHDAVFENEPGDTVRYIFLMRYPLLILIVLICLPIIACSWARRLLDSLFAVREWEMVFISGLAVLNGWSLMVVIELIALYGPLRFGGQALRLRPAWQSALAKTRHLLFLSCTLPVVGTALYRVPDRFRGLLWTALGVVLGTLLLVLTAWQREAVVRQNTEPSWLLLDGRRFRRWQPEDMQPEEESEVPTFLDRFMALLGPGYYDAQRQQPLPGHLLALTLLLAILCVYILIGFAFNPSGGWNDYFPALGYVLIVLLLLSWGLPAASFFLDRWRAPVLALLFVGAVLLYAASHTDHYYATRPVAKDKQAEVTSLTPRQALRAWMEARPESQDRMTVVALSGGGIAATAWAVEVLTGLEERIGRPFTESLHVIASASGGSVGAMYYVDGFQYTQPRSAEELQRIRKAAVHSSLPALTWGVAYPDLWRFVVPPAMVWFPFHDRGWALQEAWRTHLRNKDMTLYSLRSDIARGRVPVLLFDATVVDTGRQMVLTPVDIHAAGGTRFQATHSFLQEYPGQDLDLVTAARLSATFPWVTPICRAAGNSGGHNWHIADGAYFDNYGMTSLVEWLHSILPEYTRLVPRPKILFLRVTIRELQFSTTTQNEKEGWAYTIYGPVTALLSSGASSQLVHNEHLVEALLERWADRGGVHIEVVDLPLRIEVPLSWQLTPESIGHIRARWAEEVERGAQWEKIRRFFQ